MLISISMKIESPRQVATFIALFTTIVVFGAMAAIVSLGNSSIPLWIWLVVGMTAFGSSFGLSWWAVETFLHEKIKLIYRVLHSPEQMERKAQSKPRSGDALADVQKDVETWASVKKDEIETLRTQAQFRREFIGNLAHELRTPIFNMQGYLLTLLEGGLNDPSINEDYLSRADSNLDRLIELVKDLEGISNLESGREPTDPRRFNIIEVCGEVFSNLELRAKKKKKIKLKLNKSYDKPVWVKADKNKIEQVLTNLVLNAIHYGEEGGKCEVGFFDMSQNIMVEVTDDGIGIDAEHIPRLFERFYRVDKSRSRNEGGTGLGLAICKHILESHGQTISANSVPGEGTIFTFTLEKAK